VAELSLEGNASEYAFADVRDAVPNYESIESPFKIRYGSAGNGRAEGAGNEGKFNVGLGNMGAGAASKDGAECSEVAGELRAELNLRQEEYSSNLC